MFHPSCWWKSLVRLWRHLVTRLEGVPDSCSTSPHLFVARKHAQLSLFFWLIRRKVRGVWLDVTDSTNPRHYPRHCVFHWCLPLMRWATPRHAALRFDFWSGCLMGANHLEFVPLEMPGSQPVSFHFHWTSSAPHWCRKDLAAFQSKHWSGCQVMPIIPNAVFRCQQTWAGRKSWSHLGIWKRSAKRHVDLRFRKPSSWSSTCSSYRRFSKLCLTLPGFLF